MNIINRNKIFLLIAVIISLSSVGQQSEFVTLKKITQDQGLSSYYITKILQDKYGFMWVGTQDGLNRYDGKKIIHFNIRLEDSHRIGGALITDIVEDSATESIWVSSSYGDICCIDEKTATVVKRISRDSHGAELSKKWIRSLCFQKTTLWIGLDDNILAYDITKNVFRSLSYSPDIAEKRISVARLCTDNSGKILALCNDLGIMVIDPVKGEAHDIKLASDFNFYNNKSDLRFWDCSPGKEGTYIASTWGMMYVTNTLNAFAVNKLNSNTPLDNNEVLSCKVDKNKNVWASTQNQFYKYSSASRKWNIFREEKKEAEDWFTSVYQVFIDRHNYVWIGTQEGLGGFPSEKKSFTSFFKSTFSSVKINHAYSLLPISDSLTYCGGENGLYSVNTLDGRIEKLNSVNSTLMLFKDKKRNIYVSNKEGLFLLKADATYQKADLIFPELRLLNNDQLNAGLVFNDSTIVFSSLLQKGLYVWNTNSHTVSLYHKSSSQHPIEGLSTITNLYIGSNHTLYILTDQSDIISFNPITNNALVHNIESGSTQLNFMDMCETENSYWFGLYTNGIIETDKDFNVKRKFTTENGLSNDAVYKIIPYQNWLFATTNNGLTIINCKDYSIRKYFASDGLHSSSFEQLCGAYFNGKIYAGGVNGFTIIDPESLHTNTLPPALYTSYIQVKTKNELIDTSNIRLTSIKIPSDVLQTVLYFSVLNYSNQERVTLRYRIKEQGESWLEIPDQTLQLIGLIPGTYHLQVKAFNEAGIPSEIKELTLVFLPKWYQTWWFRALLALVIVAIIYVLYRLRINQLKKEEKIRRELASDLHDDLGSTLNSVKVYSNLALMEKENKNHLLKIKESAQEAIGGVRDLIWVLDDKKDTPADLLARIQQFAIPLCEANHISFVPTVDPSLSSYKLGKEEKRNLYMIIKESINNSIKYAGCKKIEINISVIQKKITVDIKDDGSGFEMATVKEGNGLKNIRNRSKEIHYKVKIESSAGIGTHINLHKS